jgi:hypothetical protein
MNPPIYVDAAYIKGLLTRDFISRQSRNWKLLTTDEMDVMLLRAKLWWNGKFGDFNHNGDCYIVPRLSRAANHISIEPNARVSWKMIERGAIDTLNIYYDLVTGLLQDCGGRLIAAGGAISKVLVSNHRANDIDLFFIDPEVERDDISEIDKQRKYDDWLAEAISYLAYHWIDNCSQDNLNYQNPKVYVFRNEFVTTVYLVSDDEQISISSSTEFIRTLDRSWVVSI